MKFPPIFRVDIGNFAVVTYAVPADRVRRQLPEHYELDTFDSADGLRAFVSTTCFCNHDFRGFGLPYPRHTFNESTYRTYVSRGSEKGIYFFGRYLGTKAAWSLQRPMARDTFEGDFELDIQAAAGAFPAYNCSVSSPQGNTRFVARGSGAPTAREPFKDGYEHGQFLTYRLHGYYTNTGGFQAHMPVEHPRMAPLEGELLETPTLDLWNELGIVTSDELDEPYSVLLVKEVPFTLFAPRPIRRR